MADEDFTTPTIPDETGKKKAYNVQSIAKNIELIPPEGSFVNGVGVGYRVFEILKEILDDKEKLGLPKKWIKYYEQRKNKHWKNQTKNLSLVSANLIFTHIQRTANLLTDNNPTFNVSRATGDQSVDDTIFDKMNKMSDHWWREQEQQDVLEDSVITGETSGCTIEHTFFDVEEGEDGEVVCDTVDPFYFGVYPVKTKKNQKAMANLYYKPMTVMEARKAWPEFADKIQSDSEYLKELGDERREISGTQTAGEPKSYLQVFSSVVSKLMNIGDAVRTGASGGLSDELLVVYCWVKDDTMIDGFVEENDYDDMGRKLTVKKAAKVPKYPDRIRRIITCNGGNVVMEDGKNPNINWDVLSPEQQRGTYMWGRFPFTRVPSIKDPVNGWGMTDLEQVENIQREIDKAISQFTTYKDKAVRLKLKIPQDAGIRDSEINNAAGILKPSTSMAANAINYVQPPQYPTDLTSSIEIYKDLFFLIAGTFDLDQAKTGGRDVIAYKAIAALIERASNMARGKIRNYGKLIRERGRMYLSLAQNFYTEDRWVSFDKEGKEEGYAINGAEIRIPVKMNVVSGSTLPVSQVQKREEALELFKEGVIDDIELLKSLQWDNYREVIKRKQAGPLGFLFQMLQEWGVPDEMLQMLQQIANLKDDKELAKLMEDGKLPTFEQILQQIVQQHAQNQQEDPTVQAARAEADLKTEEVNKARAETNLIKEKANTERKKQEEIDVGIKLDKALGVERVTGGKSTRGGQGPYSEKGIKSNNRED